MSEPTPIGSAENDIRRALWFPDYDVHTVEVMGQEWPDLIVEKWERNSIGERRFVESRTYVLPARRLIAPCPDCGDEFDVTTEDGRLRTEAHSERHHSAVPA